MGKNCVLAISLALLLLVHSIDFAVAKRALGGSNRKTSSGNGYSTRRQPTSNNNGHVTKPSYSTSDNAGSNSHADVAKLSYPNYNSQPNRPAQATNQNAAPIGWNVPKQQGPPPAYSATNPVGGAKTNAYDAPPAYRPNNAPPPSYGASNVHTPITATNTHGVQSSYPVQQGATYHSPGNIPAGATYYPSAGHVPAGANHYPAGGYGGYGGYPAGGGHMAPAYYPSAGHMPAGATYLPAGAAIPAGATYYSQPPQSSSGLGFGSGLAAGAIGGAILGHVLTPTNTRTIEQQPMSNGGGGGGDGKVIIINNGPPGSVTATDASGTTVITNNGAQAAAAPAAHPAAAGDASMNMNPAVAAAPLAPLGAVPNAENNTAIMPPAAAAAAPADQPPPGGIICVPVRVNDTDPADSTKMIEVEKIACYPAPPAEAAPPAAADGAVPLAPMAPMDSMPGHNSQQLQQNPTQATLLPDSSSVKTSSATSPNVFAGFMLSILLGLLLRFGMQ